MGVRYGTSHASDPVTSPQREKETMMMFTCNERHTVSRILAVATVAAWLLLPGMGQTPAFGANEKGPRCNDGIDNDGDGLLDCDDPDCNCGGDDGGGGKANQPCVIFDDLLGDSAQSDDGTPYCDNKKAKVSVNIGVSRGHLRLTTNSSAKAGVGRGLFVDFGTAVTLAPGTANEMTIQTTDEALDHTHVLAVSAEVGVGGGQDDFDFLNMPTGFDDKVNLVVRVFFSFTDGSGDSLLLRLSPNPADMNRHCPSSDSVTVTDLGTPDPDGLRKWTVETQAVVSGACINRSGEGEFGDSGLLFDVDPDGPDFGLDPGHIALSFGLTVTASP